MPELQTVADSGRDCAASWDAWLQELLCSQDLDAEVIGPFLTGILVRQGDRALLPFFSRLTPSRAQADTALTDAERLESVQELLRDSSPGGSVEEAVLTQLTERWAQYLLGVENAAAAAAAALLAQYSGQAEAKKSSDLAAAAAKALARDGEEAVERRRLVQLQEAAAVSDSSADEADDLGQADDNTTAVQQAREQLARATLERREAIQRAVEAEDRKKLQAEARRATREAAGHTGVTGKGTQKGDKTPEKRR